MWSHFLWELILKFFVNMRHIAPHLHISFHVWLLFILLFWYLRWGGVIVTLGVNGLVDGMSFFPFCGVVNVEIGEKSTISTNRIVLWAITKTIYFNKWLNNDQICLILYFFPFSVVVHVGVGEKILYSQKIYYYELP